MQLDYDTGIYYNQQHVRQQYAVMATTPECMVILSFTNADAERLKQNALNYHFPNGDTDLSSTTKQRREQTLRQLWSGKMHVFALWQY